MHAMRGVGCFPDPQHGTNNKAETRGALAASLTQEQIHHTLKDFL